MSRIAEVIAKHSAEAEPAAEAPVEATQTDGAALPAGSAPADASTAAAESPGGDGSASPGAPTPPDEAQLREKLERDRERRQSKKDRARAQKAEQERAELEKKLKDREEKDTARKAKPWLERIKDDGEDPRKVFQEMKDEALKSGTPEAQFEAMTKAFDAKVSKLEADLKAERDAREAREKQIAQAEHARIFRSDFDRALDQIPALAPLLEEYPDREDLFPLVQHFNANPDQLFGWAERLGVDLGIDLTDPEAEYNMIHIFQVLRAQQDAHNAKKQRLTKRAEPQSSGPGSQPDEAKKPTVNGAEARKAGTTIGNDLASSSSGKTPDLSNESHKARMARLTAKWG